jgi:heat shock protein HslJ
MKNKLLILNTSCLRSLKFSFGFAPSLKGAQKKKNAKSIPALFGLIVIAFLFQQCDGKEGDCQQKLKSNCVCTADFNPVCGCDKITYSNPCNAECNSITEYTPGPCASITGQTIFANWAYLGTLAQDVDTLTPVKKHSYDVNLDFSDDLNLGKYSYSGKSSINSYFGKFSLNSSLITLSENSKTEVAGNAQANAFENDYLSMLYGKINYRINQDRLLIITSVANGKTEQMIFKKI